MAVDHGESRVRLRRGVVRCVDGSALQGKRLQGEWEAHCSLWLNAQYRVTYKIEERIIPGVVMDITAHDYRRQ
jgi:hypothetical protein